MSRTTLVRLIVTALIVLALAAASAIVIRNGAPQTDAPSGFVH